jgi:hypothetical protein
MDQLINRLPSGANAIVAADVGYLRESPAIGRIRWAAKGAGPGPLAILPNLPGVKNVCIGAQLDFNTLHPHWQLALLQVDSMPQFQQMAQAAHGYTDTIGGAQAAWSPSGACFISLDANTLVSAQPCNRQMITRWVQSTRATPSNAGFLNYLRTASAAVSNQTPIVFAVDLQDAFSVPAVVGWLRSASDDSVAAAAPDKAAAAKVLATVRGLTIKVAVADTSTAVATVDFSGDTAPIAQLAKPLFLEILADHGLTLPGVESWTFTASGPTVTCQGNLTDQALRQLLSLLQSPSPDMAMASIGGQPSQATGQPAPANKAAMGAASAKYFNSISVILDNIRPGASLGEQAGWLTRYATRIDQLPAVNVDPELLSWGASVSASLRAASSILEAGQQRVNAAAQTGTAPTGSYSSGLYDSGEGQRDAQYRADLENYRRQNRQASQQIRSQVTEEANKPLQAATDTRGRIRATMVERYGADFK